ncbi:MAG: 6-phosphogluconolactonase [Hydrogenophilales bacterium 16-64-46]|nr:MAG: 6-phosphogluconolactonase [Hydrogenophilales bacterium 12-64-13]OYZ05946.1 MAG: 6-phosphogluconolactonase [Hydrogenophilales bacterium 16-64-46]OZA39882.1 MAG: 6-phosphogluconolactonase [Hydrogenophilales bacterium 17-64-34]HQT00306.1 6-phosphogluconolactonase [Thiobacillus sp.]
MPLPATRVFDTPEILVRTLADTLLRQAAAAITTHGRFHLVLAGGTTPRALYAELASRHAGNDKWHIWYGDERCLPADHPERNSVMIEAAWLAESAIPPEQRRAIPAELGAEAAATEYAVWLDGTPSFDLVLLGLGEDGHTASLFPGHVWTGAQVLAVHDAPKQPPDRVSLSAERLADSQAVWFLVTGEAKREALQRWETGEKLPAAAVRGRLTTLLWMDRSAVV